MKNKNVRFFSIRLLEHEWNILRELKDNYAANISGLFKLFLKQHLENLKKINNK